MVKFLSGWLYHPGLHDFMTFQIYCFCHLGAGFVLAFPLIIFQQNVLNNKCLTKKIRRI
jgi:hypothetical protein